MPLGIVKYAYDCSSQLIGVSVFAVSCHGPLFARLSSGLAITSSKCSYFHAGTLNHKMLLVNETHKE